MPAAGRKGDKAHAPSDAHGCNTCAHSVIGPATEGSPDVLVNDRPIIRVGDRGEHSACCGANAWVASAGAAHVLINGQPPHRHGDATQHCGGSGTLIEGSPDVIIGDSPFISSTSVNAQTSAATRAERAGNSWIEIELKQEDGWPMPHQRFRLELSDGTHFEGTLNEKGLARIGGIPPGDCTLVFLDIDQQHFTNSG